MNSLINYQSIGTKHDHIINSTIPD